ncbi:MAG: HAD-IIIA family hydrolase [Asticcacaulis sp.]
MKVVILAGGKGTRLGLSGIPKPMVPVDGVPLLERLVNTAKASGFTEFVFLNGFLSEVIEEHFGDGSAFGVKIDYVREPEPLGPAGAVRLAKDLLTEPFIVIYGDILIDVDLRHFADFALSHGGAGTLFVHPNDHPHDSDLLEVDETGLIVGFYPKPHAEGERLPNLVSAALYVLYPEAIDFVPEGRPSDWGHDVFKTIIASRPLYAYRSVEYAKDIGTPSRLQKAEGHLREGRVAGLSRRNLKPAIFIDRDGVLNEEHGGVLSAGQMKLLPGAAAAVRKVNDAGIPLICVTNQPFLAKGMITWPGLRAVHAEMDCQLAEQTGGYIDDMFICPHHPEKGWPGEVPELKIECDCRKPLPGLLHQAADFHGLDLNRSWMVGDRYCDIAAGVAAGMKTVLVRTGHGGNDKKSFAVEPDYIADDLAAATDYILGHIQ